MEMAEKDDTGAESGELMGLSFISMGFVCFHFCDYLPRMVAEEVEVGTQRVVEARVEYQYRM